MEQKRANSFTTLSLIFGAIAIFTIATAVLPFLFGSLAIIFAVLSKEGASRMSSGARLGVTLSSAGILLSFVVTAGTAYLLLTNDDYRAKVDTTFESVYGFTMEEYFDMLQEVQETGEIPEEWIERLERTGF